MSDKLKKYLLIIGFVLLVLFLGFLIYWLFFREIIPLPFQNIVTPVNNANFPNANEKPPITNLNGNENVAPINEQILPALPPVTGEVGPTISPFANGGLTDYTTLETRFVSSPTLAANGRDLVYYDKTDGFIYKLITETGAKEKFNENQFNNVEKATWSNNMAKAVFEYPDGGNVVFDFNTNLSVTLPSQWKDFSFSPDGNKLAFKNIMLDPEERYISIANSNGSDFTEIQAIGEKDSDLYVDWSPNNKYVALYREGMDASRSEIYPIGFNDENFASIRVEGRNPSFLYSPSGNLLLYSVFNSRSDFKPLLWFVISDTASLGAGRRDLGLNTWASKCTFATETIVYCAVPRTMEMGTGYIPSLADNTPDDFFRINLTTTNKTMIARPIFNTTVEKLFVSSDQSKLYWYEKGTGNIKEIKLK
ncbi:MAG: hypothetical protein NTZ49_02635 [Candidatus Parcubacteria bacterium]|nr:hypothetical protein [Candidatus Parcubacteria bacterium]